MFSAQGVSRSDPKDDSKCGSMTITCSLAVSTCRNSQWHQTDALVKVSMQGWDRIGHMWIWLRLQNIYLYTYLAVDLLQFTVLIEEQNQQRPLVLAVTRIFHNHALHYPFFPHVSGQKMAFGYWNTDLGTGNMNSCSVKAESPEVAAPAPGKGP